MFDEEKPAGLDRRAAAEMIQDGSVFIAVGSVEIHEVPRAFAPGASYEEGNYFHLDDLAVAVLHAHLRKILSDVSTHTCRTFDKGGEHRPAGYCFEADGSRACSEIEDPRRFNSSCYYLERGLAKLPVCMDRIWRAGIQERFPAQPSVRDLRVRRYSDLGLWLLMPAARAFTVASSWIEPVNTRLPAVASPEIAYAASIAPVRLANTCRPILTPPVAGSIRASRRFSSSGARGLTGTKGRRTAASIEIRFSTG